MDYVLRSVNNGWILSVPPCDMDKSAPFGDFVFPSLPQVMVWLADRHGEILAPESR